MKSENKFILFGVVSVILYSVLIFIPLGSKTNLIPPQDNTAMTFLILVNLGLWLAYLLAFNKIKKQPVSKKSVRLIILFTIIFNIILALIPCIGSADVFNYVYRARVFTVYHENPYLVATENFPLDPYYNFSPQEWNYLPMQYGPLWASISIGFSFLAQDSFFWNQFLYKILALLVNFGLIYFIGKILAKINPSYRLTGLFLYAWNPLILFEVINNGHNDILLVFFIVAATYLFLQKKFIVSLVVLLFSVLVKYLTVILFPIFLIFILKEIRVKKEKIKFLFKAGLILAAITILFYLPFWEGVKIFKGLFLQSRIATFLNLSLFTSFIFGGTHALGTIFSWSYEFVLKITKIAGITLFIIFYFWQLILLRKNECSKNIIYRNFLILSFFVYVLAFLQPWYFLWFLPLAILIHRPYFTHFVFLITLIGLLSYTFFPINFLLVLVIVLVAFLAIFTKGRYFAPFLGLS